MTDLKTGKIYKIICNNTDKVYIGSTKNKLEKRITQHKNKNNRTSSRVIIENGNFRVEVIEEFKFQDETELRRREGYHQLNTHKCINKTVAGRKNNDTYHCECGIVLTRCDNINRHKKTEKHKKAIFSKLLFEEELNEF